MEEKKILRPVGGNPVQNPAQFRERKRTCGHPFQPTFDMTVIKADGLHVTSFCAYCLVEKLGLEPCAKCIIPKNLKHPSEIKWIFNK